VTPSTFTLTPCALTPPAPYFCIPKRVKRTGVRAKDLLSFLGRQTQGINQRSTAGAVSSQGDSGDAVG